MKGYEKYFDVKECRWKNRKASTEGYTSGYEGKSITDTSTYKPSIDSVRQALANGRTIVSGMYEFNKEGEQNEDYQRIWNEWERPDISEVDEYIKSEQEKNRKKRDEKEWERKNKEYSERLAEKRESDKAEVIDIIHKAIELGKGTNK